MVIRGQLLPARLRHSSLRCMHRCRYGMASSCSKSLHMLHIFMHARSAFSGSATHSQCMTPVQYRTPVAFPPHLDVSGGGQQ